jgi:hypothetical protein
MAMRLSDLGVGKQALLFEKRSKNFYPFGAESPGERAKPNQPVVMDPPSPQRARSQRIEVFWFFFSKKNRFLASGAPC